MKVCVPRVSRVVSDLRFAEVAAQTSEVYWFGCVSACARSPQTHLQTAAHLAMARVSLVLWVLVGVLAITVGAWFGVERVLFSTPLTHYEVRV